MPATQRPYPKGRFFSHTPSIWQRRTHAPNFGEKPIVKNLVYAAHNANIKPYGQNLGTIGNTPDQRATGNHPPGPHNAKYNLGRNPLSLSTPKILPSRI